MEEIQRGLAEFVEMENRCSQEFPEKVCVWVCGTLQASKQVLQGYLYRVSVEMSPVDRDVATKADCIVPSLANGVRIVECFSIWSRNWISGDLGFKVKEQDTQDFDSCLKINS